MTAYATRGEIAPKGIPPTPCCFAAQPIACSLLVSRRAGASEGGQPRGMPPFDVAWPPKGP
jgi:hypothetical protein